MVVYEKVHDEPFPPETGHACADLRDEENHGGRHMHSARRLAPRWTAAARTVATVANAACTPTRPRFETRSHPQGLPRPTGPARLVAAAATAVTTAAVAALISAS